MASFPTLSRQAWPHDPQELNSYYGDPRGFGGANPAWVSANLTTFTIPWKAAPQTGQIHAKVKSSLDRVLAAYWDYVGQDQAKIDAQGLHEFGGSYNYRVNRNNPSVLSNHARGIAVDFSPTHNANGSHWQDGDRMLPREFVEAFKAEGWRWGGDFNVTKDPMHFEAVYDSHHDQPPIPAPQTTQVITPVQPQLPLPSGMNDLLGLTVRKFILDRTGIPDEIDKFRADLLARAKSLQTQGQALATEAQALIADINAFTVTPLPHTVEPHPTPAPVQAINKQTGVTATLFGGPSDPNTSAYDGHRLTDTEPGCALPYRFSGTRPMVCVSGPNGATVTVPIVDVGPWNTNDPYWLSGKRPQAESGTDMRGRRTNLAGIDLTPKTAHDVGINGKGKVDWWFANQTQIGDTKMATGQTDAFLAWVVARLKEPSTYSSIAAIGALAVGHSLDPGLVKNITTAGAGVAAVLGIFLTEGKS